MNSVKLCSPIVVGFITSTVPLDYVQDAKSIGIVWHNKDIDISSICDWRNR